MAIEKEIRRCKDELKNEKLKTTESAMSAELRALESEIFGSDSKRRAMQKNKRLGALGHPNQEHGNRSYYFEMDGKFDMSTARNLVSCLSGGMFGNDPEYKQFEDRDPRFHVVEYSADREDETYQLVVHKTNNKSNKLEACSISVFNGKRFVAYLFSTNDPLAFDNFNCFRGIANPNQKPEHKCVEQMVFCECKVKINLKIVETAGHIALFEQVLNNSKVSYKLIVKVAKQLGIDIASEIEATRNSYLIEKDVEKESELNKDNKKELNDRLLQFARDIINKWANKEQRFFEGYMAYFKSKLALVSDLIPEDNYKSVGRDLIAVGNYLKEWDSLSLMCAISARMQQLGISKTERSLAAALMPACIAECSKNDSLWGYVVNSTAEEKLNSFTLEAKDNQLNKNKEKRIFEIIDDATFFQNRYIEILDQHLSSGDNDATINFLFMGSEPLNTLIRGDRKTTEKIDYNVHKLGLSERIIQSLWTRQIIFSDELNKLILAKLAKYDIGYNSYIPTISPDPNINAYSIMKQIGSATL